MNKIFLKISQVGIKQTLIRRYVKRTKIKSLIEGNSRSEKVLKN